MAGFLAKGLVGVFEQANDYLYDAFIDAPDDGEFSVLEYSDSLESSTTSSLRTGKGGEKYPETLQEPQIPATLPDVPKIEEREGSFSDRTRASGDARSSADRQVSLDLRQSITNDDSTSEDSSAMSTFRNGVAFTSGKPYAEPAKDNRSLSPSRRDIQHHDSFDRESVREALGIKKKKPALSGNRRKTSRRKNAGRSSYYDLEPIFPTLSGGGLESVSEAPESEGDSPSMSGSRRTLRDAQSTSDSRGRFRRNPSGRDSVGEAIEVEMDFPSVAGSRKKPARATILGRDAVREPVAIQMDFPALADSESESVNAAMDLTLVDEVKDPVRLTYVRKSGKPRRKKSFFRKFRLFGKPSRPQESSDAESAYDNIDVSLDDEGYLMSRDESHNDEHAHKHLDRMLSDLVEDSSGSEVAPITMSPSITDSASTDPSLALFQVVERGIPAEEAQVIERETPNEKARDTPDEVDSSANSYQDYSAYDDRTTEDRLIDAPISKSKPKRTTQKNEKMAKKSRAAKRGSQERPAKKQGTTLFGKDPDAEALDAEARRRKAERKKQAATLLGPYDTAPMLQALRGKLSRNNAKAKGGASGSLESTSEGQQSSHSQSESMSSETGSVKPLEIAFSVENQPITAE